MTACHHASTRAQQRGIPPLIQKWLDEFGEEIHDGHGGIVIFFSRRSVRNLQRVYGRESIRRLDGYLDAYKVERCSDGSVLTIGHRFRRLKRP